MSEIVSVKTRPDNILLIEMSDGRKGTFDVKPFLFKSEYRELTDAQLFQQVKSEGSRLCWPRGHVIDVDVVEANLVVG